MLMVMGSEEAARLLLSRSSPGVLPRDRLEASGEAHAVTSPPSSVVAVVEGDSPSPLLCVAEVSTDEGEVARQCRM